MIGGGKYDAEATTAREAAKAKAVVLVVFHGDRGSGFSVQCVSSAFLHALPEILREIADEIERDLRAS